MKSFVVVLLCLGIPIYSAHQDSALDETQSTNSIDGSLFSGSPPSDPIMIFHPGEAASFVSDLEPARISHHNKPASASFVDDCEPGMIVNPAFNPQSKVPVPPARKLTRQESKENAQRVSRVIADESPNVTTALERSMRRNPSYQAFEQSNPMVQQAVLPGDPIKEELMKWALEELATRHNEVNVEKKDEKKKRIFASIVALIASISAVVAPIVTYIYTCDDSCSCG